MPTPQFLLSAAQMRRLSPHFPLSHGIPRVDNRRVLSGIIYVIRHGLQWRDAPIAYGPHKTLYNRCPVGAGWASLTGSSPPLLPREGRRTG
mgnify:FL=1